jgi:hypothetical protein
VEPSYLHTFHSLRFSGLLRRRRMKVRTIGRIHSHISTRVLPLPIPTAATPPQLRPIYHPQLGSSMPALDSMSYPCPTPAGVWTRSLAVIVRRLPTAAGLEAVHSDVPPRLGSMPPPGSDVPRPIFITVLGASSRSTFVSSCDTENPAPVIFKICDSTVGRIRDEEGGDGVAGRRRELEWRLAVSAPLPAQAATVCIRKRPTLPVRALAHLSFAATTKLRAMLVDPIRAVGAAPLPRCGKRGSVCARPGRLRGDDDSGQRDGVPRCWTRHPRTSSVTRDPSARIRSPSTRRRRPVS